MKDWKGKKVVRDNLVRRMPKLVDDYFDAGDAALAPGTSWEQMHRFRLLTKRFRYTLEIFRPAYGPGIDARIEALRNLQTLLGDINDCVVTAAMLEQIDGTGSVRDQLSEKAASKTVRLRALWAADFAASGKRQRWRAYLTNYACRPGRVPRTRRLPQADPSGTQISAQTVANP